MRSAFETLAIIAMLYSLSPLLATTLLVAAPLLTPVTVRLTNQIGAASKQSQVGHMGCWHAGNGCYLVAVGGGC